MIPSGRAGPRAAAVGIVLSCALGAGGDAAALPQAPAGPAATAADPEALASQRFQEGTSAFDAGDFVAAARLFLEAYAARPHHASLWNAARAERRAGELARAANLYRRYLREAPIGTPDRDAAIADLALLEPRLGRLEIVAPDAEALSVDGARVGDTVIWVNPGEHVVRARVGGVDVSATPSVGAGAVVAVALVPPLVPPRGESAPRPIAPAPAQAPAEPEGGWPAWAILPFAGATVLAAGGLVASGVDTLNLREEFDSSGGTSGYAYDNGIFAMRRTNALVAVTAGLGAITVGFALFAIDWNGGAPGGRVVGSFTPGGLSARAEL